MSTALQELGLEQITADVIVRPMLTIDDAIDVFLASGFQDTTRARYSRVLDKFADRFPRHWDVAKVKESDCLTFLAGYSHRTPGHRGYIEKVMSSFFTWLYKGHIIRQNPMDRIKRTRLPSPEDLDVKGVSTRDVPKLLAAAEPGAELNCIAIAAYLGPRRAALARLRLRDYDREQGFIRFYEKGGKTIWKPVPDELALILEASVGLILPAPKDYLIPPQGPLLRAERDDRVIWRIVTTVAKRAGVTAHVHALRAAFATYYLETHNRDIVGLQELMGHESIETTKVYLRKMDRRLAMEGVRDLSWAAAETDNDPTPLIPAISGDLVDGAVASGGGRIRTSVGGEPWSEAACPATSEQSLDEALKQAIPKPLPAAKGTES